MESVAHGGGPFGAVVVADGAIIGEGNNQVTRHNDPTAHAEIEAIRAACAARGSFSLDGATIYSSCEPCPMCLAAAYWARIGRIVFAAGREDAADAGFDDNVILREIATPVDRRTIPSVQLLRTEAQVAFAKWKANAGRVEY